MSKLTQNNIMVYTYGFNMYSLMYTLGTFLILSNTNLFEGNDNMHKTIE